MDENDIVERVREKARGNQLSFDVCRISPLTGKPPFIPKGEDYVAIQIHDGIRIGYRFLRLSGISGNNRQSECRVVIFHYRQKERPKV